MVRCTVHQHSLYGLKQGGTRGEYLVAGWQWCAAPAVASSEKHVDALSVVRDLSLPCLTSAPLFPCSEHAKQMTASATSMANASANHNIDANASAVPLMPKPTPI